MFSVPSQRWIKKKKKLEFSIPGQRRENKIEVLTELFVLLIVTKEYSRQTVKTDTKADACERFLTKLPNFFTKAFLQEKQTKQNKSYVFCVLDKGHLYFFLFRVGQTVRQQNTQKKRPSKQIVFQFRDKKKSCET